MSGGELILTLPPQGGKVAWDQLTEQIEQLWETGYTCSFCGL